MNKRVLHTILLSLVAVTVLAQTTPQPKVTPPQGPRLSDTFCKTALTALKAIQRDQSIPKKKTGELYANGATTHHIDQVEIEASSKQERTIAEALHNIYLQKLLNNMQREIIKIGRDDDESLTSDPEWVELKQMEDRCFGALDNRLHERSPGVPAACKPMLELAKK
jgi:hypothetical protein